MTYGSTLKSPRNTDRTPSGRQSWKSAQNQASGNLRWILSFLSGEETIAKLTEIELEDVEEIFPVSKRYQYLNNLKIYHKSKLKACEAEIERLEEHAKPEDLQIENTREFEEVFLHE